MIRLQINMIRKYTYKNGYTLVEIIVSTAITIILITILYNFYTVANLIYSTGLSTQALEDGANTVLIKMIEGKSEPTGMFRLAEGVSYTIPSINRINFVGTDGVTRSYRLNNSATALIYNHLTIAGATDETIYTAPVGATIILRFSVPNVVNNATAVVNIDVALTQPARNSAGSRLLSGSASTIVNLRNH